MSGLAGHMNHPFDNLNLNKDDLKSLVNDVTEYGSEIIEKLDGYNIHVFYNNGVKFARNKKDLMNGGMTIEDMINKWSKTPHVMDVYIKCAKIIVPFIEAIKNNFIWEDPDTIVTLNCECIIKGITNVLYYPEDAVYIHNYWVWYKSGKEPYIREAPYFLKKTAENFPQVHIKNVLKFTKTPTTNIIRDYFFDQIDKRFGDCYTIEELYKKEFTQDLQIYSANTLKDEKVVDLLFNRVFKYDKSVNIKQIREMATDYTYVDFIYNHEKFIRDSITWSLKTLVYQIGDFLLGHLSGYFSENHKGTVIQNIMDNLNNVEKGPNYLYWEEYMNKQINPLEGFVVSYMGDNYKFTGSFAIINRILNGQIKR